MTISDRQFFGIMTAQIILSIKEILQEHSIYCH